MTFDEWWNKQNLEDDDMIPHWVIMDIKHYCKKAWEVAYQEGCEFEFKITKTALVEHFSHIK